MNMTEELLSKAPMLWFMNMCISWEDNNVIIRIIANDEYTIFISWWRTRVYNYEHMMKSHWVWLNALEKTNKSKAK